MKLSLILLSLTAALAVAEVPATIAHQGRLVADGLNFTGTAHFKFQIYQSDAGTLEPATGEATISTGFNGGRVTSIRVLHGGKGYTSAPVVTLEAPSGTFTQQATARANITGGAVTSFTILTAGSGYSAAPSVKVAAPAGMGVMWSSSGSTLPLPGRNATDEPPDAVALPVSGGLYNTALGNTALTNMRALAADLVPDPGKSAYLRVWVATDSRATFQELFPHQPISPVAYARHAATAGTAETILSSGESTAGLLVTGGALGAGPIPAEGEGSRLMWYSAQRAFRAGSVTNVLVDPDGDGTGHGPWDEENIGRYSTAMGYNTTASGTYSTAFGYYTTAEGTSSFASGFISTAPEPYSAALGLGLKTSNSAQTVVGKYNGSNANALFVVGNGISDASRNNAFAVSENGDTFIGGNASITGNILQTGNHTTGGTMTVFGAAEFKNTIEFDGTAAFNGIADFDGNVKMDSALTVDGAFRVNDNTTITGTLAVNGAATLGAATISGNVSAQNLNLTQNFTAAGDGSVKTLTITGGADIAEPFDLGGKNMEPGTVLIIDEDHTGRLRESMEPADRRVAGVVSGAGGINPGLSLSQPGVNAGGHPVALAGRVYVKATGPIRAGDLLTTSDVPGHAMRAGHDCHGAVLGKAMSSLKEGRGLVLVLVSLQ